MPNHNGSPRPEASSGSITGPVDDLWAHFSEEAGVGDMRPDQANNAKYVFYAGACGAYNLFMLLMRDGSQEDLVNVTKAVKVNFDKFFNEYEGHQLPPKMS